MFSEDDLIPISALQHYVFCPRQWGLIHIEQLWSENRLTAEGRVLHDKTHEPQEENRPWIRIVRTLRLVSYRLGITGQADVVEFHKCDSGIKLEDAEGFWKPVPVEYKRGKPKIDICDEVQICAQAMCLEEMLKTGIESGFLFYGRPRRRQQVDFTDTLRKQTEHIVEELHKLTAERVTPKAKYGKKCKSCSLFEVCLPEVTGIEKDIEHYLSKAKTIEPEPDLSNGAQ
ncbi:MAG: CRISPR-associated protein Cas4 [Syntrophaceae bacterium]|nr:CRISPR-associated protein Cas4 [Syntrophaceae bacterium]